MTAETTNRFAPGLPDECACRLHDGTPILVKPGDRTLNRVKGLDAEKFNIEHGVTKAQELAMYTGVILGWDQPAADPQMYDEKGHFLLGKDRKNFVTFRGGMATFHLMFGRKCSG